MIWFQMKNMLNMMWFQMRSLKNLLKRRCGKIRLLNLPHQAGQLGAGAALAGIQNWSLTKVLILYSIPLELETSAADYDEIPDDFIPQQHTAKKHIPGIANGPDPSHVYTEVNKPKTAKDSASSKPPLLNTVI